MDAYLANLEPEIQDADEETFELFAQRPPLPDLGMLDGKASEVEMTVAGRDYTIKQMPSVLQSKREGGTTGATIWRTSIELAKWLAMPSNVLFGTDRCLDAASTVLELGSGVSGLVPMVLSERVGVIATDQAYILKTLQANIQANKVTQRPKGRQGNAKANERYSNNSNSNIRVLALDWEQDDVPSLLRSNDQPDGVDAVVACDCIFNYALIDPFVQTCADICGLRRHERVQSRLSDPNLPPTFCLIVQQLRQAEVFEQWLRTFMSSFRVWRLTGAVLSKELGEGSGFVVHLGLLR